jgi:hypothetical protein
MHSEDLAKAEPQPELRKVKRRKGRRALVNFEKLPVHTHVCELSTEQRATAGEPSLLAGQ